MLIKNHNPRPADELWEEVHDLPDTKTRTNCWIAVSRTDLEFEDKWIKSTNITYFSASKGTGWALPSEFEILYYS